MSADAEPSTVAVSPVTVVVKAAVGATFSGSVGGSTSGSVGGVTAPGTVQIHGNSLTGPVNWQLVSDVAELVLCYWALVRSRHHPQLLSGTWIPVDWVQKTVRTWGDIHPVHEIVLRRLND